jgi:NADPH:quinone reductase-like Zn-dependent oxidoreductase
MKALEINDKFEYHLKEVPIPKLSPGKVLVKIHAAALNRRDVWIGQVHPLLKLKYYRGFILG